MPAETPLLLALSGHTPEALRDRARTLAHCLRTNQDLATSDILYTLATRRSTLNIAWHWSEDGEELSSVLEAFADGRNPAQIVTAKDSLWTAPEWLSSSPGKVPNGGAWVANCCRPYRSSDGKSRDAPAK